MAALLVALGLCAGLMVKWVTKDPTALAGGRPTPSPLPAPMPSPPPAAPMPMQTPAAAAPPAPEPAFATDDRGFVNSTARCDGTQSARAIGRTEGSLVVICAGPDGQYEYVGVRLSDEAALQTVAESSSARAFLAHSFNVTYAVSPSELRVTVGDRVIKQEPMIEYREPRPVVAAPAPR